MYVLYKIVEMFLDEFLSIEYYSVDHVYMFERKHSIPMELMQLILDRRCLPEAFQLIEYLLADEVVSDHDCNLRHTLLV